MTNTTIINWIKVNYQLIKPYQMQNGMEGDISNWIKAGYKDWFLIWKATKHIVWFYYITEDIEDYKENKKFLGLY